jgi:preprotein translocase subunit SecY
MTSELGQRIAFTLGALLVYRLGTFIPLPGIDPAVWSQIFHSEGSGLLATLGVFSGGAIHRLAIFALGVMPYISAAIILQLMAFVSSTLRALSRRSEHGRRILDQYTLYLTLLLTAFQAYGIAVALEGVTNVVVDPGWHFRISTMLTLTAGTMFLVWLSGRITVRGVGNGLALILVVGIVTELPSALAGMLDLGRQGILSTGVILLALTAAAAATSFIAFMEHARRQLTIEYPARQVADRPIERRSVHLPLKLNMAGLIPALLASWLAVVPMIVVTLTAGPGPGWWNAVTGQSGGGHPVFLIFYVFLIVVCAFFYSAFVFDPDEAAETLKQYGGIVAGAEPGEQTAAYIDHVLSRTTLVGAFYLALVCLIPEIMIASLAVPFYFGGTSLLIVVCTVMDLRARVQSDAVIGLRGERR